MSCPDIDDSAKNVPEPAITLSVVIPAHNEERVIEETVRSFVTILRNEGITHELLIVNDNSVDSTQDVLAELCRQLPTVRYINNRGSRGFGEAVKCGLNNFNGECVAIVMADGSDDPNDLVRFFRKWSDGYDCVFGDRFNKNSKIVGYPWPKLCLNRLGNNLIRFLFLISYRDVSNAFKLYSRNVATDLYPLQSSGFNLTVEMPLKSIVKNYTYAVVPNNWYNRNAGRSKWKINETLTGYLIIVWKCWLEKFANRKNVSHHHCDK